MATNEKILGGLTEPELVKMIIVGSCELVGDKNVVELCGKIENYIQKGGHKQPTFYEAVLKDLNTGSIAKWKQKVIKVLIDNLGIWLPVDYYYRLPIIRPYVIRDVSCRVKTDDGHDEWSMPDNRGYLRDDNSLVKAVVKTMAVAGWKVEIPHGSVITGGFTASHVWRMDVDYKTEDDLVSRDPDLNTFVPNLVWLPAEVAKMTDREGSFAQRYLQVVSRALFRQEEVPTKIKTWVNAVWKRLPAPVDIGVECPDVSTIPRFVANDRLIRNKIQDVNCVAKAVDYVVRNGVLPTGRGAVASRYSQHLTAVPVPALKILLSRLRGYAEMLDCYDQNVKLRRFAEFDEVKHETMIQILPKSAARVGIRNRCDRVLALPHCCEKEGVRFKAAHQVSVRLRNYLSVLSKSHSDVQQLCSVEYTHAEFGIPSYSVLIPIKQQHDSHRYYAKPQAIGGEEYLITNEWHVKQLMLLKSWLDAREVAP